MRLYQIIATCEWFGVRADAHKHSRQIGGSFEQIEVPTDKPGLLRFLNVHRVGADEQPQPLPEPEPTVIDIPRNPVRQSQESFTASEIEDFILNRATVAQAENIFACLGTRFAEMASQWRAA